MNAAFGVVDAADVEIVRGDLVAILHEATQSGADGLHSTLRVLAFGPEPSFVRHLGMYLSVFTVPNDMGLDHWQLIHVAPGTSVTVTSARDNTEARAIFFFASPARRL